MKDRLAFDTIRPGLDVSTIRTRSTTIRKAFETMVLEDGGEDRAFEFDTEDEALAKHRELVAELRDA